MAPRTIVTDKWRAYAAAFRDLGLNASHHQAKWKNNRIEGSHVQIRRRERAMQGFRSPGSAQPFLSIHAAIYNHFTTRRHLISSQPPNIDSVMIKLSRHGALPHALLPDGVLR
jgi:transposase-like protein